MKLNHIMLFVSDFDACVSFYKSLGLNAKMVALGEFARFEMPVGSATLALHVSDTSAKSQAMHYFQVDDVDRMYADLSGKGITFDSPPTDQPWRWREAVLRDPSGNAICLYQ